MRSYATVLGGVVLTIVLVSGCGPLLRSSEKPEVYNFGTMEPEWIRNGEPIEFEGELWYPQDDIELLLDSEVYRVGKYKDVEIFIEKVDVKPYNRLYTKFNQNKFRLFEIKRTYD